MDSFRRGGQSAAALVVLISTPLLADSPIVGTTGDAVQAEPPPVIVYNEWESDSEIRVWFERTTKLGFDAFIGFTNTGRVDNPSQQISGTIPTGTWVSSSMIRLDPATLGSLRRGGSVTFDHPIIGVDLGAGIGLRDPIYSRPGVVYNTNDFRGLELLGSQSPATDWFSIAEDRLSVEFSFEIGDWTDDLRVITEADCPADLNSDGISDNGDIGVFIALFLDQDPRADLNGDGIIDQGDIGIFIDLFVAGC